MNLNLIGAIINVYTSVAKVNFVHAPFKGLRAERLTLLSGPYFREHLNYTIWKYFKLGIPEVLQVDSPWSY